MNVCVVEIFLETLLKKNTIKIPYLSSRSYHNIHSFRFFCFILKTKRTVKRMKKCTVYHLVFFPFLWVVRRLTLKKRMEERPETSYSNEDDDDGGGMKRKKSEGGKRIKSLMKMYRRKLQDEFEVFPRELLVPEKLDLHRWSFMIKDEALEYLANVTYKRSEAAAEEAARKEKEKDDENSKRSMTKKTLPPGVGQSRMDILELARSQLKKKKKLLPQCSLLNIHEAPKITDVGLQYVGESCATSLRVLDIGGCRSVTDSSCSTIPLVPPLLLFRINNNIIIITHIRYTTVENVNPTHFVHFSITTENVSITVRQVCVPRSGPRRCNRTNIMVGANVHSVRSNSLR